MKTILFRGKPVDKETIIGEDFYFGNLVQYASGDFAIRQIETGMTLEVVPETICQFTGANDKKGNKIFEGDILRTNEADWIGKVVFKHSAYIISDENGGYSTYPDFSKCEIIGNIFDNAEMVVSF